MFVGVSGARPYRELTTYVRDRLVDRIQTLPGAGEVALLGFTDPNLRVWLKREKMRDLQITVDDVVNAISTQHSELPGGVRELSGIAQGGELDATERKRVLGSMGLTDAAGGAGDPYAGAREARAARAAAIAEAMNAIDIQTLRQKAALAGAQFAAPTDTGGYFPQLGPNSPLVRSGLADPMRFTPTPYNAQVGGDQAASDLAMLRSLAGVG